MDHIAHRKLILWIVLVILIVGLGVWTLYAVGWLGGSRFVGPPPGQNAGTTGSGSSTESTVPPGFKGPTGEPHVNGPSGPPPMY